MEFRFPTNCQVQTETILLPLFHANFLNSRASRIITTHSLARAIERAEIKPSVFVSTSGVGILNIYF